MQILLPVSAVTRFGRPDPEAGLSLVEVVVALLLLAIGLVGIAVSFPASRGAVHLADRLTTAVALAQETLEGMRNRRYTADIDEITPGDFPTQDSVPDFPGFRRSVTIVDNVPVPVTECVPPPGTPCSKTVTVSVSFREPSGNEQSVELTTILVR